MGDISRKDQEEKKFDKVVIISDSRLKSMQPSWSNDSLYIPEIIAKDDLKIRDVTGIVKTNAKLSNLSFGGTLLVLSVGINDIIDLTNHPECTSMPRHQPMKIAVPRQGEESQITKEVILRMQKLKQDLTNSLNEKVVILFSHIIPLDVMQYQNDQRKQHSSKTKHSITKPLLNYNAALDSTKKIFQIVKSINSSLDNLNLSNLGNLPKWDFFPFTEKMYAAIDSGSSMSVDFLEDGLNPSRFTKNIMARHILELCSKYVMDTQKKFEEVQRFEEQNKKNLLMKRNVSVDESTKTNNLSDYKSETKFDLQTEIKNSTDRKLESYHDLNYMENSKSNSNHKPKKGPKKLKKIEFGDNNQNNKPSVYSRLGPSLLPKSYNYFDHDKAEPEELLQTPENDMSTKIDALLSFFRQNSDNDQNNFDSNSQNNFSNEISFCSSNLNNNHKDCQNSNSFSKINSSNLNGKDENASKLNEAEILTSQNTSLISNDTKLKKSMAQIKLSKNVIEKTSDLEDGEISSDGDSNIHSDSSKFKSKTIISPTVASKSDQSFNDSLDLEKSFNEQDPGVSSKNSSSPRDQ